MQQDFTIKPLNANYSEQALALVACEFSANSPLHRAMGITSQEYHSYLSDQWQSYVFDGPLHPLGAFSKSGDELLACLITTHFPVTFEHSDSLPEKHKPIAALLQELELQYLQNNKRSGDSLLVDLAVVTKKHSGLGIYQQLRTTLNRSAASAGYSTIYGELSSAATQHVCVNSMRHQVVAEIFYKDFIYRGKYPFAKIQEPTSIQLVAASI